MIENIKKGIKRDPIQFPTLLNTKQWDVYNQELKVQRYAQDIIDVILNDIHKGIPNHKNIPIPVRNKITWNTLLDKISIGLYPYLILFLISNKSANDLSNLDKSYLRDGRVNYKKEIK